MRQIVLALALCGFTMTSVYAEEINSENTEDQTAVEQSENSAGETDTDDELAGENSSDEPTDEARQLEGPMTLPRMAEILKALDENAVVRNRAMQLTVADVQITIITDPIANRMRAFSAFKTLDGVDGQELYRMMQANFDAALDARYAIAKGHVLSVFIHPLAELQKDQLIEGLGQVVNLVKTFGTAYTSGGMTFGGGDSRNLHRELIDDLLKKGEQI